MEKNSFIDNLKATKYRINKGFLQDGMQKMNKEECTEFDYLSLNFGGL